MLKTEALVMSQAWSGASFKLYDFDRLVKLANHAVVGK